MEADKNASNWHISFSEKQSATGNNLRHCTIMTHLFNSGLKKNSTTLEIGCGIGTLTGLIHKNILQKVSWLQQILAKSPLKLQQVEFSNQVQLIFL